MATAINASIMRESYDHIELKAGKSALIIDKDKFIEMVGPDGTTIATIPPYPAPTSSAATYKLQLTMPAEGSSDKPTLAWVAE